MNITPLLEITITVILIVVTWRIMPWIKTKVSAAQRESLDRMIDTMVQAAEQIYDSDMGKQKFDAVINWLSAKGVIVDIAQIEAAVYRLKNSGALVASDAGEDEYEYEYDDIESDA